MTDTVDIQSERTEAIEKNQPIFKKLMTLSISELVRLQEINNFKSQKIKEELEFQMVNNEAPNEANTRLAWKKIDVNGKLLDAALEKKYDLIFSKTKI